MEVVTFCTILLCFKVVTEAAEYECTKFDYDERTLMKLVKLEHRLDLVEDALTKRFEDFKSHISRLLNDTIERVETNLATERVGLEDDVISKQEEFRQNSNATEVSLNATIQQIDVKISAQISDLETTMATNIEKLNAQLVNLKDHKRSPVTFNANYPQKSSNLLSGEKLLFQNEVANTGAFNRNTGIFTVPVDGTYMFMFQICTHKTHIFHVELMAAGSTLAETLLQTNDVHACTSSGAVGVLEKGNEVYLKVGSETTSNERVVCGAGRSRNFFMGALVY